jgi:hypothetical protein
MTRILAIEGTGIRLEIEKCEDCPAYQWSEAPSQSWCGLTDEFDEEYDFENGTHKPRKIIECPLPEKKTSEPHPCPKCGKNMRVELRWVDDVWYWECRCGWVEKVK